LVRKAWLYLPPQWMHTVAPFFLKIYAQFLSFKTPHWKSVTWKHLYFPNPLGTAGGLDKNAKHIQDWWALGVGFCEVGTVTPKPQTPNPSKILDRNLKHLSLWNHMGFPNKGMSFVKKKLLKLPHTKRTPILVNIGKNRSTSLKQALEDYKQSIEELYPVTDIFIINISSPNTSHLRQLFNKQNLPDFLNQLTQFSRTLNPKIPLILKLSPDETKEDFLRIIDQSLEADIDGWCVSNSTSQRPIPNLFPNYGAISGQLLATQSLTLLKQLKNYIDKKHIKDKLIISCGGVLTPQDVLKRLQAGAHLVQVYSAIVFQGPHFFKTVSDYIYKNSTT